MVDIITEINIHRPIASVATYAQNPDNAPVWYVNIKSAVWKTEKPMQLGSKIAFIAFFLGKELAYTYEIVDFVPNQRLVMRTAQGPFPMETTYEWVAISENETKMTLRNTGQPSGFSKIIAPLMAIMMRKANRKDLKNLKKIIENN